MKKTFFYLIPVIILLSAVEIFMRSYYGFCDTVLMEKELIVGNYNEQRQEVIKFTMKNNISIIKDLENCLKSSDFRDAIHLNSIGQKQIVQNVITYLIKETN